MNTIFNGRLTYPRDLGKDTENPKHLTITNYAPFPPYYRLYLQQNAYKPRDLLNATVAAFHRRNNRDLSSRQKGALTAFTTRFADRVDAYGRKPSKKTNNTSALAGDDVRYLARQLDKFFFFQQVTERVEIQAGFDVVGPDPLRIDRRVEGETFRRTERSRSFVQIAINVGARSDGRLYPLDVIVGQLMHEMVHAYLLLFACTCWRCERDSLNTVGVEDDGHGPIFLMLHRLILTEMRKWDASLKGLLAGDCPGTSISRGAVGRAVAAMRTLDEPKRRTLNPVRSHTFANYLVRFSAGGMGVLVNPSLVTRQLQKEGALRTKKETQKLREEWHVEAEEREGEYDDSDSSSSSSGGGGEYDSSASESTEDEEDEEEDEDDEEEEEEEDGDYDDSDSDGTEEPYL
ncbi:hypothetical protein Hte_000300 [Hypoxylon texense]